jgi:hypothetical protein
MQGQILEDMMVEIDNFELEPGGMPVQCAISFSSDAENEDCARHGFRPLELRRSSSADPLQR